MFGRASPTVMLCPHLENKTGIATEWFLVFPQVHLWECGQQTFPHHQQLFSVRWCCLYVRSWRWEDRHWALC